MEIKINKRPPSMIDIMRQHYEENLRDEMAKSALTQLAHTVADTYPEGINNVCKLAYAYADAMLEARKKSKQES